MDAIRAVPSVCNHLHLPAQSGSDRILEAMNRGYTRARYLEKIDYLRKNVQGITFSTDIIVGFPGETDSDFQESLDLLREVEYDQLYAFAYSPRPGTAAPRLGSIVPESLKQRRLKEILEQQRTIQIRRNGELVGRTFEVLVDGAGRLDNGLLKGRTRCNRIVHFPGPAHRGDFIEVRITRAHAHSLIGESLATLGAA
jgi:tRNA-2-methylthio-N6-dimethylallyladenosine synthase